MSYYADDLVVHMGGDGPLAGTYTSRDDFNTNWIGASAATQHVGRAGQRHLLVGGASCCWCASIGHEVTNQSPPNASATTAS